MDYEVRRITKLMRFDINKKIKTIYDFSKKDYYVDTEGNLYYRREKLIDIKNNFGYITNAIKDNEGIARTFSRQQIVAQTFLLDSFKEGMTVDHINRIRHDNRLENLRWSTAKQQIYNQNRKIHKANLIVNTTHQLYLRIVPDQREYFINNITPKFDKQNYIYLTMIYELYNAVNNNYYNVDQLLLSYARDYTFFKTTDDETVIRAEFYDYFYPKVRKYHFDKAKEIASQATTESLDVSDFEKIFKDKKYVKKEFKEYCMNKFALKKEVFKNKDSINLFLEKIGFQILHKRTGDYIIKLGDY